ncbi:hypothetical protein R84B8_02202 [Treponema sp. R8-4-B8]
MLNEMNNEVIGLICNIGKIRTVKDKHGSEMALITVGKVEEIELVLLPMIWAKFCTDIREACTISIKGKFINGNRAKPHFIVKEIAKESTNIDLGDGIIFEEKFMSIEEYMNLPVWNEEFFNKTTN